ncbi:opsin 5-like 1 isoform B [Alligator mississippiensis]|uniref:Opsin 5-like 1 isoform B n=1 Tax=Alligator mississippiensis TaxID=8496 RepID=A0A151MNR4_ALLMI|nr:opsin 5-like 1 isoform B [Alligator mississippiensis]
MERGYEKMGSSFVNATFQSKITETADIMVGTCYMVFGICSFCGNTVLLYVSYKKKNLLKPAEYFIINLAISDLGMTLTLCPLAVTSSFSHRWLYGKHVCLFYAFCAVLFGICSMSTLSLLSIVCCLKICFPAYGNRFKRDHGRILLTCAWTYAAIFAFSPLAHWGEYGEEPYGTACCIDWHSANVSVVAMSYIVAVFIFCFILPCGVIVTSYTLILITVKESRKAVEQHISGTTRMSNMQAITIKMSVAVCTGFFAAWSPYAIIAMWAVFGSTERIPPLIFVVPAVFAKSSTLYNPVVYLLLRPHFRNTIAPDCADLQQLCIRTCFCLKALPNCSYRSVLDVRLKTFKGRNESSCNSVQTVEGCSPYLPCEKCNDTFECFKNYPKCCPERFSTIECTTQENVSFENNFQVKVKQGTKKSVRVVVRGEKRSETDHLEITLEATPVCSRFTDL